MVPKKFHKNGTKKLKNFLMMSLKKFINDETKRFHSDGNKKVSLMTLKRLHSDGTKKVF